MVSFTRHLSHLKLEIKPFKTCLASSKFYYKPNWSHTFTRNFLTVNDSNRFKLPMDNSYSWKAATCEGRKPAISKQNYNTLYSNYKSMHLHLCKYSILNLNYLSPMINPLPLC